MQILLTEAEHAKLTSAAEGGELRAQELFKAAMKVYSTEFLSRLGLSHEGFGFRIDHITILNAHRNAFAAAEKTLERCETPVGLI